MPARSIIFCDLFLFFKINVSEKEPDAYPQKGRNTDVSDYAAVKKPFRETKYISVF